MDEHKLAELFRDAVRDAPPASFDEGDVRVASHRATVRRRNAVALGSTMVAVLVFGGVAVGTGLLANPEKASTSGMSGEQPGIMSAEENSGRADTHQKGIPAVPPTQGGETPGSVGPEADKSTPGGCGQVDRKLADALAVELPVAAGLTAEPVTVSCPAESRAASYVLADGRVSAVIMPKDAVLQTDSGTKVVTKPAVSGATVYVFTDGTQEDRLEQVATRLAEQF